MQTVPVTARTRQPSEANAAWGADPPQPAQTQAAWTADALRSVWARQQGRVHARIALIERAVTALADDRLDTDLRADAERAAHMLAGSLGMFGYVDAAGAAHELEAELAHPTPERTAALPALVLRLRSGVQGPVSLRSEIDP
jgi:HPt (histidine-containing phosphotransfer) domain-containing protein